jgi:Uma2 family endonuclease
VAIESTSSEGDDDGEKRSDFQSLASLEAYVLVAQDQRRVEVYRRTDGEWGVTIYRDGDAGHARGDLPAVGAASTVRA